MTMATRLEEARASTYVDHLVLAGLRPRTVRAYVAEIRRLMDWTHAQHLKMEDLSPSDFRTYADTRPNTPGVRRHIRSALRHWWEWQGQPDWSRVIEVPKEPPMVCKAFESDEMERVAKTARRMGWRAGTAVIVGLGLGLRNEELRSMKWEWFDRSLEWVTIIGKGNRMRTLAVPEQVAFELAPRRGRGFVFEGRFGGHVTHATISLWVKQVCEEAGLDPRDVWPHRLRHSFGAEANDETGDLRAVARAMGHARTETTEGYTRTTQAALRKVSDAVARRLG